MIERLKFRGRKTVRFTEEIDRLTMPAVREFLDSFGCWITTDDLDQVQKKFPQCFTGSGLAISWFWLLVEDGSIDPATVGQWTGLKDKNGVEIYEGDRCEVSCFHYPDYGSGVIETEYEETGVVAFLPETSAYGLESGFLLLNANDEGIEVIGNIHDEVKHGD